MRKYNFDLQLFAEDFVSADTLKGHFSEEELQAIAPKEEQPIAQEPTEDPIQEPEVNEPEPEHPAPGGETASKHVPYDRFKEVNEKNKMLAAELAALKAAQPQPQAVQQPLINAAKQDPELSKEEQADKKAREQCKIDSSVDVDDLQYTDPALYRRYIKALTKEEFVLELDERLAENRRQQVYSENVSFVNELQSIPDFPVLMQFAEKELDELPRREAKKIDDAYGRVNAGLGNKDDFVILREFANKCKEKMSGINTAPITGAFSMPQNQQPAPTVTPTTTNPLDKAANLPRASNLSGAKTSAMSWAQVEQLIREGKADQIPKEMLKQIDPRLV